VSTVDEHHDESPESIAALAVPPGSTVLVVAGFRATEALRADLRARGCQVVELDGAGPDGDGAAVGEVDAVVAIHALGTVPDPEGSLLEWRKRLRPGGRIVTTVANAGHAAVRLGLLTGELGAEAERALGNARLADLAGDAARSLLERADLHLWYRLPVRGDLDAFGLDRSAFDDEVVAEVMRPPDASVAAWLLVAGPQPAPPGEPPLVEWLRAELDRSRAQAAELQERGDALERQVEDVAGYRHALDRRDATIEELEQALRLARAEVRLRDDQLAEMEPHALRARQGFARLGVDLDARLLASPGWQRLYRAFGRVRRRLLGH
jgi:SAM-dependent methyltransferase